MVEYSTLAMVSFVVGFICFMGGILIGTLAGGRTDKQQAVAYAMIALIIGIIISLGMWSYSQRQDARLFGAEASGTWTMPNLTAEGWTQQRDTDGNIYYTQGRVEARVK